MSYEDTWAKAAEADSQITKHFDHWLDARPRPARHARLSPRKERGESGRKPALSPRLCRVGSDTTMGGEVGGRRQKLVSQRGCYWLVENQVEVEEWRASLEPRDRRRWQSPEVVMREYRRAKRPPAVQDPNAPKKEIGEGQSSARA